MPRTSWSHVTTTTEHFHQPQREYGILPFWFLNGELDPDEVRFQLAEFRDKEMPGIILHGRFGLELEYLGRITWSASSSQWRRPTASASRPGATTR